VERERERERESPLLSQIESVCREAPDLDHHFYFKESKEITVTVIYNDMNDFDEKSVGRKINKERFIFLSHHVHSFYVQLRTQVSRPSFRSGEDPLTQSRLRNEIPQ